MKECGSKQKASMRPGPKRPRKQEHQRKVAPHVYSFNEAGAEKAPETRWSRSGTVPISGFNEAGAEKAPETEYA